MATTDPHASLKAALAMHVEVADLPRFADTVAAAIKAAIRDAIPGRQQRKNLDPIIAKAMKAAVRTLRRRARS